MAATASILIKAIDEATAVLSKVEKELGGLDKAVGESVDAALEHADATQQQRKALLDAAEAADKAGRSSEDAAANFESSAGKFALAGAALGAALGAMAVAAQDQIKTQAAVRIAIGNAGDAVDAMAPKVEALIGGLQDLTGVSDETQRKAFVKLVAILGDTEKAMAALPTVIDAAAVAQTDAATVAQTLGRALAGQANTAESLGITFDKNADFTERLAQAQSVAAGTAEAMKAPLADLTNGFSDLSQELGTIVLDKAQPLIDALVGLMDVIDAAPEPLKSATIEIAALSAALLVLVGLAPKVKALTVALEGLFATLLGKLSLLTLALGAAVIAAKEWADAYFEQFAIGGEAIDTFTDHANADLDDFQAQLAATGAATKATFREASEAAAAADEQFQVHTFGMVGSMLMIWNHMDQVAKKAKEMAESTGESLGLIQDQFGTWVTRSQAVVSLGFNTIEDLYAAGFDSIEDAIKAATGGQLGPAWAPVEEYIAIPVEMGVFRAADALSNLPVLANATAQAVGQSFAGLGNSISGLFPAVGQSFLGQGLGGPSGSSTFYGPNAAFAAKAKQQEILKQLAIYGNVSFNIENFDDFMNLADTLQETA